MPDDRESKKELAKRLRRAAYERAKAYRAKDPKFLALKEAAKAKRREIYQDVKARRKAVVEKQKAARQTKAAEERHDKDLALMQLVRSAVKGPFSEN